MSTLIIAEKNKAALAIAEALGTVKVLKQAKNLSIYHVPSKNIYVLPLRGHILEHRNTHEYKSWTNSNPREIITKPHAIKKFPKNYAGPYIKALKEYAKLCNHCIIGTDADIEGCNIGFFDALPYIKKIKPNIAISQLWLSSLQKNEIQKKFQNLITPKFSWGEAGESRAIIDAFIGFSATREVTNIFKSLLKKFNVNFTSIGRVQTSTLYLLYLREKEILDFVPEKYYIIDATLISDRTTFKAYHKNNPFKKENIAKAKKIYEKIKDEKIALIENYNKNLVNRSPPTPLNTNKALVLLTRILKISALTAMNTMNTLYLNKIISYPRTDSDIYKPNFNHIDILRKYSSHSQYGNYSSKLLQGNRTTPTRGRKDEGDHPPITPLESLELSNSRLKSDLEKKVYDILSRHYLALFGQDAKESRQDLELLIKDEPFKAQIISIIDEGFFEIAPFLKPTYDTEIIITGNKIPIKIIELNEKETKPPPRYTDTTLLKLMEKHGLGTKSTRPAIIQIMQKRKVIFKQSRRFFISELGIFLIENLLGIWLPFLEPSFTKKIETKIEDIKDEKRKMRDVITEVREDFLELFDKLLQQKNELIKKIDKIKVDKSTSNRVKEFPLTTSVCPYCKKVPMKYINVKDKRFLVCSDDKCKKYLSLPKRGYLRLMNSICSICGFNIFTVFLRKANRNYTYYICPSCWTQGLKDKIDGKGFCSKCDKYKISNNMCVKK